MSFLFSSSHLPASRVRRPALEDDDHDENPEAMPRSGGVRASSHLEGRVAEPETARSTGGSPAPRSSGAGIDWMARLKELAEQQQQRRRADSAASDSGPRRADDEHEPDAGAEHDDGAAPGDEHEEGLEQKEHEKPENTSSWYHSPESGSYHHPAPMFHLPQAGIPPAPQDSQDTFHDNAMEGSARREQPTQLESRLLERRTPPDFRDLAAGQSRNLGDAREQRKDVFRNEAATQRTWRTPAGSPPRPASSRPHASKAFAQSVQPATPPAQSGGQNAAATPSSASGNTKDTRDPLTILSEKFAAFPKVVESLQGLNRVPTGRLMIEKLATVADKIQVGMALSGKSYIDNNGVFRVRRDIDPATLGHEFQHLGEMLFGTEDPFIKVSHPSDATAYPGTGNMGKEFRAMRIQNQLLLERARMMGIIPLLNRYYYFDDKTKYLIPGEPIPPPPPQPLPPQPLPPQPLPPQPLPVIPHPFL